MSAAKGKAKRAAAEPTSVTLEELFAATESTVTLPLLSERMKKPVVLRFRAITRQEWQAQFADYPPGSEEWPRDPFSEWKKREVEWLASLTSDERRDYNLAWADVGARTVALAAIEPELTAATAKRFGNDLVIAYNAILDFSGLLEVKPPAEDMPAPEPAEEAAA